MADEAPTTPPPAAAPPAPVTPPAPADQHVPYDRFREVNERAKAAETQLAELSKWKEEQEAKGLSELERVRKQQQDAERRAAEAEHALLTTQRSGYLRAAAQKANFMDPEDAVAFLGGQINDLDTPEKANKAVEALMQSKPHLISPSSGFDGGARTLTGQPDQASKEFMEQLQTAQAKAGWQSISLD